MSIRWTKEQEDELLLLLKEGKTVEEISRVVSKTPANVKAKIKMMEAAAVVPVGGSAPDVRADIAAIKAQMAALTDAIGVLERKLV